MISMDGKDDNVLDMEHEFQVIALQNEIEKLKSEVTKYKILLNEIDSDVYDASEKPLFCTCFIPSPQARKGTGSFK